MRILFIHQNFPGQFPHLARHCRTRGDDVVALTDAANRQPELVRTVRYDSPGTARPVDRGSAGPFAESVARGERAAAAMLDLKRSGYLPDVIVGHPGWGEMLFCGDVFPAARRVAHAEFYYGEDEEDLDFDPEFQKPASPERAWRLRARNAAMLLSMVDADALVAPTRWQARRFPAALQPRIVVAHEGIDTASAAPDASASITLQRDGVTLSAGDEVLTFVARNLEPYRGYHVFMRALPQVLAARPKARAVIVGGDGVSYGAAPADGRSWKAIILAEVRDRLPMDRIHFVGRVPHATLTRLFQISAVHSYLSYPFVVSWSLLEAMAAEAPVVAARTAAVDEVITHGRDGLLVDFHDTAAVAATLIDTLARPRAVDDLRATARRMVVDRFDLRTRCLPRWLSIIDGVAEERDPAAFSGSA